MKPTIIEDEIFEFEPFEKDGSELMAAEASHEKRAIRYEKEFG